ncbi:MAG: ABC-F family ATP-binding cassette domain-containing protein [Eubacteriales bacterium]
MRILNINNLDMAYAGKTIFSGASLTVGDGKPDGIPDHIGLVGPNGCGKSTLIKIICGELVPDSWSIDRSASLRIGKLDQYADLDRSLTVYEYLDGAFDALYETERRMNDIYDSISELPEEEMMRAVTRAGRLSDYLDEHEFDRIPKKLDNVIAGLGFTDADREKSISQLSGGMKTKLILGRLLLSDDDLLILDEPTNFLDIAYIGWLADWLCSMKRAYIVISHDTAFLSRITNRVFEISGCRIRVYEGGYDYYLAERERRDAVQLEQHIAQEKFIARSETYIAANSGEAMGGISRSKATWLKKMLDNLEHINKPDEIVKPQFAFCHASGAAVNILTLSQVSIGYNKTPVMPPLTLSVKRGDKIIFKGYNGVGKTTLLKTICGELELCSGNIEYGDGIESVFLRQEEDYEYNFSHFDKNELKRLGVKRGKRRAVTVIEFAKEYYPEKSQKELSAALFSCGIKAELLFNAVRTLSGGELTKLRLCLAMLRPVNLIILDEPTNHLDVYSKEVLMHSLETFPGTVLMTTHDVNADISWATKLIELRGEVRTPQKGSL